MPRAVIALQPSMHRAHSGLPPARRFHFLCHPLPGASSTRLVLLCSPLGTVLPAETRETSTGSLVRVVRCIGPYEIR